MESTTKAQRFRIADLMVLTASTAACLAMSRYYWWTPMQMTPVSTTGYGLRMDVSYQPITFSTLATTAAIVLTSFSPALLWMTLRRRQTPLSEILRRPGIVALLVSTLFAWGRIGRLTWYEWSHGRPSVFRVPAMVGNEVGTGTIDLLPLSIFNWLSATVGPLMIVALVMMLVLGRWRGSAGWLETSGRVVGTSWILLYLATLR